MIAECSGQFAYQARARVAGDVVQTGGEFDGGHFPAALPLPVQRGVECEGGLGQRGFAAAVDAEFFNGGHGGMQGEAFGGYGAVPLRAAVLRRQHGIGGGGGKLGFSGFDLRRFGVQVQVARGDVDFQARVVQLYAARAPTAVAADEEVRLVAFVTAAPAQGQIGHLPAVCQARGRAFELPFRLFRPQRRFQTAFRFDGRLAFVGIVDFQVDVFKCVAAVARVQQQAAVFDNQAVHRQRTFFLQQIADVPAAVRRAV